MKKVKIFAPAERGAWHRNAVIGGHISSWDYIISYKEAADMLVDYALSRRLNDFAFLPVCQLYRHALELSLKTMIFETDRLVRLIVEAGDLPDERLRDKDEVVENLEATHNLQQLLNELEERLVLVSEEEMDGSVRRAVTQLHMIDPSGQAFRYATKRASKDAWLPKQNHYDLLRIKTELGEAIDFLTGGVGGWLDSAIENARDFLAEMAREADY